MDEKKSKKECGCLEKILSYGRIITSRKTIKYCKRHQELHDERTQLQVRIDAINEILEEKEKKKSGINIANNGGQAGDGNFVIYH